MISILFSACKQNKNQNTAFSPSSFYFNETNEDTIPKKDETKYSIVTPYEISEIFNKLHLSYNDSIFNPADNEKYYLSSSKAAMNIGIYCVDFSFINMFGISQNAFNYMVAIHRLSNNFGIPDKIFMEPISYIDKNLANADSVASILQNTYKNIEEYLKNNGEKNIVGLIILGSWVEAMYIATQLIPDPDNPQTIEIRKIAEQKYTLNSILSMLKNYYDDSVIVYYTKKLKYLKRYFDTFDIYFTKGDLEIDTVNQVFKSSNARITISPATYNDIKSYISHLRTEMTAIM